MENNKSDDKTVKAFYNSGLGPITFEGTRESVAETLAILIKTLDGQPTRVVKGNSKISAQKYNDTSKRTIKKIMSPKFLSDFIPKEKFQSLTDFLNEKKASKHMEICACAAYWLKTELNVEKVSVDEIYTVYKIVKVRPPKFIEQVFRDAKRDKNLFDQAGVGGYYLLTNLGEAFVEFDLPKNTNESKRK